MQNGNNFGFDISPVFLGPFGALVLALTGWWDERQKNKACREECANCERRTIEILKAAVEREVKRNTPH